MNTVKDNSSLYGLIPAVPAFLTRKHFLGFVL